MLGDTAVAVHPEDERYKHLVGKQVRLPLTGRLIPDHRRRLRRSGVRHGLRQDHSGPRLQRLRARPAPLPAADQHLRRRTPRSTMKCRSNIAAWIASTRASKCVADLEALGLVEKIEPHTLQVPRGDRSNAVLEPWLTDQWYVRIAPLAEPAIKAVEDGRIRFVPENWAKTYYQWMHNIQDWCISRQLWWGHQIPGVVRRARQHLRRAHRRRSAAAGARQARPRRGTHSR